MSDITIIIPPYTLINYPLIGVAYIESFLLNKGYDVEIIDLSNLVQTEFKTEFDFNTSDLNSWADRKNAEKNVQKILENDKIKKILNTDSKIIGFSNFWSNKFVSIELAKYYKKNFKDKFIVFGGPDSFIINWCEWIYEISGKNIINMFVNGEGEFPLEYLLKNFQDKEKIKNIPNTCYATKNEFKINKLKNKSPDLEEFDFPIFKGFKKYKYSTDFYPLLLSRGCISRCVFCDVRRYWPKFRQRKPEKVFEEIKYQIKENKINQFFFCDSLLNANIKQLEKLCDLIIEDNLNIEMHGIGIAKPYMTLQILKKMKKAGFTIFEYGIESGSQRVLTNMGKLHKAKNIDFVIKNTYDAGIRCNIDLIAGFPMETQWDYEQTCKMIIKNHKYLFMIAGLDICHIGKDWADYQGLTQRFGLKWDKELNDTTWKDKSDSTIERRYIIKLGLYRLIRKFGITLNDFIIYNEMKVRKSYLNKNQQIIEKILDKYYFWFYRIKRKIFSFFQKIHKYKILEKAKWY